MTDRVKLSEERQKCKCGRLLIDEIELDTELCERCADLEFRKYQERIEWDYYHNDSRSALKEQSNG